MISYPVGATSAENLEAKCEADHRLKHEGNWTHRFSTDQAHPPGTLVLISPTGHVFVSYPFDYRDPWPEQPRPGPGRGQRRRSVETTFAAEAKARAAAKKVPAKSKVPPWGASDPAIKDSEQPPF